jgi:hypothetical protein
MRPIATSVLLGGLFGLGGCLRAGFGLSNDGALADRVSVDVAPFEGLSAFDSRPPEGGSTADGNLPDGLSAPCEAGGWRTLIDDGFENSFAPIWQPIQGQGDNAVLASDAAHSGDMGLRSTTGPPASSYACVVSPFVTAKTLRASAWVLFESGFASMNQYAMVLSLRTAGNKELVVAGITPLHAPGINAQGVGAGNHNGTPDSVVPGRWYHFELQATFDGDQSALRLTVDGAVQVNATNLTFNAEVPEALYAGITWQGDPTESFSLLLDDVILSAACEGS